MCGWVVWVERRGGPAWRSGQRESPSLKAEHLQETATSLPPDCTRYTHIPSLTVTLSEGVGVSVTRKAADCRKLKNAGSMKRNRQRFSLVFKEGLLPTSCSSSALSVCLRRLFLAASRFFSRLFVTLGRGRFPSPSLSCKSKSKSKRFNCNPAELMTCSKRSDLLHVHSDITCLLGLELKL